MATRVYMYIARCKYENELGEFESLCGHEP